MSMGFFFFFLVPNLLFKSTAATPSAITSTATFPSTFSCLTPTLLSWTFKLSVAPVTVGATDVDSFSFPWEFGVLRTALDAEGGAARGPSDSVFAPTDAVPAGADVTPPSFSICWPVVLDEDVSATWPHLPAATTGEGPAARAGPREGKPDSAGKASVAVAFSLLELLLPLSRGGGINPCSARTRRERQRLSDRSGGSNETGKKGEGDEKRGDESEQ